MATYVYGNTVRKETVPAQKKPTTTKKVSHQVQKNRKRATHLSKGYVMFIACAAAVALMVCVQYLQLQSEVSARSENITSLQHQLTELREENVAKEDSILNSINLQEVKTRAMKDLGMVYATSEQIVYYQDPVGNKVTQYNDIPESGVVASADGVN